MMERLEESGAGMLVVRVGGVLRHEDYVRLEGWLDVCAGESSHGKADVVFELGALRGMTPRAMLDDARLGLSTANREVRRMALVAEGGWLDVMVKMFNPITRYVVRHFEPGEREAALAWAGEPE